MGGGGGARRGDAPATPSSLAGRVLACGCKPQASARMREDEMAGRRRARACVRRAGGSQAAAHRKDFFQHRVVLVLLRLRHGCCFPALAERWGLRAAKQDGGVSRTGGANAATCAAAGISSRFRQLAGAERLAQAAQRSQIRPPPSCSGSARSEDECSSAIVRGQETSESGDRPPLMSRPMH